MFQFNFNVNSEAETDPQTLGGEHGETVQVWLPAQKHEITHSHLLDPSDVIAEITLCKTKMKYLTMSSALKKLQEKETACNLSTVLDKHSDLVPAVYEGGLTIWECTWDLLNHLADMDIIFKNKRVLEIGCGAALPAIFCALHGAHITLQDYD
ncbi:histidine protein methyltransferase 1 homolog isoform X2 [Eriocheir sinensis]|uniref:histidine protein methyltransferase 1 homolog isoform X2 n=1 Tax=Eriocheir sinensis TaxID=95602 RepID=UPI0021C78158|nr:histidine protein methyltransferase 1 homolog isoform X2 [Eriocheir sinensis]